MQLNFFLSFALQIPKSTISYKACYFFFLIIVLGTQKKKEMSKCYAEPRRGKLREDYAAKEMPHPFKRVVEKALSDESDESIRFDDPHIEFSVYHGRGEILARRRGERNAGDIWISPTTIYCARADALGSGFIMSLIYRMLQEAANTAQAASVGSQANPIVLA